MYDQSITLDDSSISLTPNNNNNMVLQNGYISKAQLGLENGYSSRTSSKVLPSLNTISYSSLQYRQDSNAKKLTSNLSVDRLQK
jgi:hypothetical protein